jgi:hypothetical protein
MIARGTAMPNNFAKSFMIIPGELRKMESYRTTLSSLFFSVAKRASGYSKQAAMSGKVMCPTGKLDA